MADLSEAIQMILGQWREEESRVKMDEEIPAIRKKHVGRLQRRYKTAKSERKNNLVPGHTDYIRRDGSAVLMNWWGSYEVNYCWPDNDGFAEEPHETELREGDLFDRIGDEKGRYVCRIMDGRRVSVDERSLPYYLIARTLTGEPAYHCYRVIQDFSALKEKISKLEGFRRAIRDNYRKSKGKIWEGTVLASFGRKGGGNQLILPLSIEELLDLKVIEEILVR